MSSPCWSDIAMLTPILSDIHFIEIKYTILPHECLSLCESNGLCDAWAWRRVPEGNQLCAILSTVSDDDLSLDNMTLSETGTLTFVQWHQSCSFAGDSHHALAPFYIKHMDPQLLNSPWFKPGDTTDSPVEDQRLIDVILGSPNAPNLSGGSSSRKTVHENGVEVQEPDLVEFKREVNASPVECEWICEHGPHDMPCVAFVWESEGGVGTCNLYDVCPQADSFFRRYEVDGSMELGDDGHPTLSSLYAPLGPRPGFLEELYRPEPVITGLDIRSCSFPDVIPDSPFTVLQWVSLVVPCVITLGTIIGIVYALIKCRKQDDDDWEVRSLGLQVYEDTIIYDDLPGESGEFIIHDLTPCRLQIHNSLAE